jgi:hypothetical protein
MPVGQSQGVPLGVSEEVTGQEGRQDQRPIPGVTHFLISLSAVSGERMNKIADAANRKSAIEDRK